jgi:hypothetical protein
MASQLRQEDVDNAIAYARRESLAGNRALILAAATRAAAEEKEAEAEAAELQAKAAALIEEARAAKRRRTELMSAARELEIEQAVPRMRQVLDINTGFGQDLLPRFIQGYTQRFPTLAPGVAPPPPIQYNPYLSSKDALALTAAAKSISFARDDILVKQFDAAVRAAKAKIDGPIQIDNNWYGRRLQIPIRIATLRYFDRMPPSLFALIMNLAQQAANEPGALQTELTNSKLDVLRNEKRPVRYRSAGLPTKVPALLQRADDTQDTVLDGRIQAAWGVKKHVHDIKRVFDLCEFLQEQMLEFNEDDYVESTCAYRIFESTIPLPSHIVLNFLANTPARVDALIRRIQDPRNDLSIFYPLKYSTCICRPKTLWEGEADWVLFDAITEDAFKRLIPIDAVSSSVPVYMDNAANRDLATTVQGECMQRLADIVYLSTQISAETAAQYIIAIPIVLPDDRLGRDLESEQGRLGLRNKAIQQYLNTQVLSEVAEENVELLGLLDDYDENDE